MLEWIIVKIILHPDLDLLGKKDPKSFLVHMTRIVIWRLLSSCTIFLNFDKWWCPNDNV